MILRPSTSLPTSRLFRPALLPRPSTVVRRRTFIRQPERDPSRPPTHAELEEDARIGRLRIAVVTLPLVVVCGYILYKRVVLGEEQRQLAWEGLGGTPPGRIGGPLAGPPRKRPEEVREEEKSF